MKLRDGMQPVKPTPFLETFGIPYATSIMVVRPPLHKNCQLRMMMCIDEKNEENQYVVFLLEKGPIPGPKYLHIVTRKTEENLFRGGQ